MRDLRPVMIVYGGPPGSGKSSMTFTNFKMDYFNFDNQCAVLWGSYHGIPPEIREQAGKFFKNFIDSHINAKKDFVFESTLRKDSTFQDAQAARKAGFKTEMVFICTSDPEINKDRIIARAKRGGHSATEMFIEDSYYAALKNAVLSFKTFDSVWGFDNSEERRKFAFQIENGKLVRLAPDAPDWSLDLLDKAELFSRLQPDESTHREHRSIPDQVLEKIINHQPDLQTLIHELKDMEEIPLISGIEKKLAYQCLEPDTFLNPKEIWELDACKTGRSYGSGVSKSTTIYRAHIQTEKGKYVVYEIPLRKLIEQNLSDTELKSYLADRVAQHIDEHPTLFQKGSLSVSFEIVAPEKFFGMTR